MPRESDRFREYVDDLENRKWRCTFCKEKFAGSTPRIRAHLAGIPGRGIKACKEVKDAVRAEALETFNGKGSGLDKSTGGTSGKGTEGTVFGASQSVLPSEGALNPNGMQNSNQHACAPQQQSFYRPTGTGTAPACPQDQASLPPSDMSLDNLDNTQQSDPSNHWLDAAHGNENASSLQPLSSLYIGEPPALPELSTLLEFGTGAAPACPQYEVSLPREGKSTGGTSGEGTEGTDTQNSNQLGCAPQQPSFYPTTGTGTAPACPQEQGSLPPSDMLLDNLDTSQPPNLSNHWLDAALGYEIAPPVKPLSSLYISEPPALTELYTHLEFGGDVLPTPLLGNITTTSIPQYSDEQCLSFDEQSANGVTLQALLYSTENLHNSLPENLRESHDVDVSTFEEIQMNEVRNPTGGSSLKIDSSLDVDRANRLQDCGQPCVVEVAPVRSNASPTDTVQHPCQLPQRCEKEDGNDTRRFPSRTPMDIDPSIASQHTSVLHSLVPEASTNEIGPSSSRGVSALIYISTMVPLDPYYL
ncbi:hypothetical protein ACJRO7_009602 [Eucalyptus globulus]|uniref:BED-type domain-containing protein n=1 Tax=Eucalyptus globulus TaxID=34317 RepID=A0ABD3LEW6_EUCGL